MPGYMDITACYHCLWPMYNWADDMDPWVEHVGINPSCPHLILVKGPEYIRKTIDALREQRLHGTPLPALAVEAAAAENIQPEEGE